MRRLKLAFIFSTLIAALLSGGCQSLQNLQTPDDQTITSDVQSKLFADSSLKTRDIRVATEKGIVTLSGTVQTELEKGAAENLASQSKGVKKVVNQLAVGSGVAATPAEAPPAARQLSSPEATRTERAVIGTPNSYRKARKAATSGNEASLSEPGGSQEAAPTPPAQSRAVAEATPPPQPPPPPQPEHITVPAGTVITVRMIDAIDSAKHRPGEEFAASVDSPVVIDDRVIIRKGSDARVRLIQSRSAGRMTGQSELSLELVGLAAGGQTFAVESSGVQKVGASRSTRTAETVGGGAALGALIGAIAGHGKGAAIGAAVGAGAGTAVQASTKGQQVQIPAETKLDFSLKAPLTVTM